MISIAHAAEASEAAGAAAGQGWIQIAMLAVFVLVFWLMIWRPQSKRAKAHKNLLTSLTKGDEVVTNGGIVGRIVKTTDDFIVLEVGEKVELSFQKGAVVAALPKGTLKALK